MDFARTIGISVRRVRDSQVHASAGMGACSSGTCRITMRCCRRARQSSVASAPRTHSMRALAAERKRYVDQHLQGDAMTVRRSLLPLVFAGALAAPCTAKSDVPRGLSAADSTALRTIAERDAAMVLARDFADMSGIHGRRGADAAKWPSACRTSGNPGVAGADAANHHVRIPPSRPAGRR